MHPTPPTPAQVCGTCKDYEPARNDAHYGYCKPQMALDRERGFTAGPRLVDVTHRCFMASAAGKIAHAPRAVTS